MKNLIKADLIQLLTTRTAKGWAITIALFMLFGGVTLAILASFGGQVDGRVAVPTVGDLSEFEFIRRREFNPLVFLFVLTAISSNYRHRVAVTEQLVCGDFWKTSLSKMIVFGGCGAIVSVVQTMLLALPLLVWPGLHIGLSVGMLPILLSYALLSAFAAICAVAFARLLKNQLAVVLAGVVYIAVLDPILRNQVLWEFLKINGKLREFIIQSVPGEAFMNLNNGLPMERLMAAGVILMWVATLCATTYLLDRKRDWR